MKFTTKLTSDTFDAKLGQFSCFTTSAVILLLSFWKLAQLELSEAQLFFGILLASCVSLLFIVIGLLLPLTLNHKNPKDKQA